MVSAVPFNTGSWAKKKYLRNTMKQSVRISSQAIHAPKKFVEHKISEKWQQYFKQKQTG